MSLIIKNEPMPDNCYECPCCRHDSYDGIQSFQCNITLKMVPKDYDASKRMNCCPLEESE